MPFNGPWQLRSTAITSKLFNRSSFLPVFSRDQQSFLLLAASRDTIVLRLLNAVATRNGWSTEAVQNGWSVMGRLQYGTTPGVLLLDVGEEENVATLRWVRKIHPSLPIVLIVSERATEVDQSVLRLGTLEFARKPLQEKSLEAAIRRLVHRAGWSDPRLDKDGVDFMGEDAFFGASSTVMRKLRSQLVVMAQMDVPVLITGEKGSGEEVAAQLIHRLSQRSASKFVTLDCGAFPGEILEMELFGCDSEAEHQATYSQPGKLDLAEKGTVFLEDLVEMPLALQAKLLRTLREKRIWRVGSGRAANLDVRLVASVGADTHRAIEQNHLLEDLYIYLSNFTVAIPPLRQRADELLFLLDCFMRQLSAQYRLPARAFSLRLLNACQNYSWPGNLRELEDFVRRYLVIGDDDLALGELSEALTAGDSVQPVLNNLAEGDPSQGSGLKSLVESVKGETERNAIGAALEKTHWNRKAAAKLLKVSYRSLLYKIEHYRMSPPPNLNAVGVEQGSQRSGVIHMLPRSRSH
jgi:two-component system response regulator AtoC